MDSGQYLKVGVDFSKGVQKEYYTVNGGYYNLTGKVQPISQNPYPTQEQPIDNNYKFIGQSPSNIKQIYIDANNSVAKI